MTELLCYAGRFFVGLLSFAGVAGGFGLIIAGVLWLAEKYAVIKIILGLLFGGLCTAMLLFGFYAMGEAILGACK